MRDDSVPEGRPAPHAVGLRRLLTAEAVLAATTFVVVALAWSAHVHQTGRDLANSGYVYERIAELVLAGEVPYRDFLLEYPPLMLVPALPVASVTHSTDQFYVAYAGLMAVIGGLGVLFVARTLVLVEGLTTLAATYGIEILGLPGIPA
ncbi:MAG: hypothetical protein OEW65_10650 [Thermoleophilia bacterium]|nr:hypothetical protein [Thermoleophilia bacterium]